MRHYAEKKTKMPKWRKPEMGRVKIASVSFRQHHPASAEVRDMCTLAGRRKIRITKKDKRAKMAEARAGLCKYPWPSYSANARRHPRAPATCVDGGQEMGITRKERRQWHKRQEHGRRWVNIASVSFPQPPRTSFPRVGGRQKMGGGGVGGGRGITRKPDADGLNGRNQGRVERGGWGGSPSASVRFRGSPCPAWGGS